MTRTWRPATGLGWWAFGLGIAAAAWGLCLTSALRVIGPALASTGIRIPMGFTSAAVEVLLAVAAVVTGAVAVARKDRAWLVLGGLAAAVIVGGFWIVFALGEVVFPH